MGIKGRRKRQAQRAEKEAALLEPHGDNEGAEFGSEDDEATFEDDGEDDSAGLSKNHYYFMKDTDVLEEMRQAHKRRR